jgi:hypothetical protein
MSGKYALIIGNTEYIDPGLAQLTAPGKDVEDLAGVLKDQSICAFDDVKVLLNQLSSSVIEAIDEFFDQKKPDDLLVVFFSGHGVRDEFGSLFLAVRNTIRSRLRSTAIRSDYIREAMDQSRSKRQVVILDCCNSGAFPQGTKAEVGGPMGLASALQGYGRFVLTASDATQFAWEGDKVIGETQNSLFTHFLVKGLKSEADNDGDGRITVDELYDYAYDQISRVTPKQTPTKSAVRVEGEIVLRQFTRLEDIKPVALPDDLVSEIEDLRPYVREAAVQKLEKIIKGKNIGMSRSAREALETIAVDDNTTRRVAQMATQLLESIRQTEQKAEEERKGREEAERVVILKSEEQRLTAEKAEAERKAKEESESLVAEQRMQEQGKARDAETFARSKIEPDQKAVEPETVRLTAEHQKAGQQVAHRREHTKTLSESFVVLKSSLPRLIPFLKIAGFVVIIAILFWIGAAIGPNFMSLAPAAKASATLSPTATFTFTHSPLPPTKTASPVATSTRTPIPSPTKTPTSNASATRALALLLIKNAITYWDGADFYVDGVLVAQGVQTGQTIQTSVYFGTHELCVRRRSTSVNCNGRRTFEVKSDPHNLQWP